MDKDESLPELEAVRKKIQALQNMSCLELSGHLGAHWELLSSNDRTYITSMMAHRGCQEAAPYLLRQLESKCPFSRRRALVGLKELGYRESRPWFIELYLNDPDDDVRRTALINLSVLFRDERDIKILRLALAAWDNPTSSVGMRLNAGAAMMYQLDIPHDEHGAPAWWDEENEYELEHPSMLRAATETRQMLAPGGSI